MADHGAAGGMVTPLGTETAKLFIARESAPGYARRVTALGTDPYGLLVGPGRGFKLPSRPTDTRGLGLGQGLGGRREDEGDPTGPSQLQNFPGRLLVLIPVAAGSRLIELSCRYWPNADPRPALLAKRSLELGLHADVEAVAPSGDGWVTISLTVPVGRAGVLECYRCSSNLRQDAYVFWDNLRVS